MTTQTLPLLHFARRAARLMAVALAVVAISVLSLPPAAPAATRQAGGDRLTAASHAVAQSGVGGIAWYVDDATDRVVVTVDSTVSKGEVASIKKAAGASADALRIEHASGVFRPLVAAGDAIYGSKYRCSLGFNVIKAGVYYFLTAGHCGKPEKTWWTSANHSTLIGATVGYSFPGNDYALVRYDNAALTPPPGGFTAGNAFVGEAVKRTGSTTGTHSGTVTALNVSVRYQGGGKVDGMIQTTVCSEPGDSGGPMYAGATALGITSGGSGDCTRGGVTFFQPVTEAASVYGVTVY